MLCLFVWWCLMPLSTIFQLYRGGQFYWCKKPEDPYRPLTCRTSPQTLSHNVVHLTLIKICTHNISGDCIGSCKSNYHTITATTAPHNVMKRKFELWWPTILFPAILTKWITTSQLTSMDTKRPCHMMLEIGPSLRQTQKYGGVIQVNGSKTLP